MSRTIDEKVVEMRFDNSNFERNVSQSMSTLDKLKSALDFSDAGKAFEGITSAANKVSFGGLTSALDGVGDKFSALETIATGALLNIGRKVEDFVSSQIKSVTLEPIMEGFGKYADKTSSVQMIMNAIRDGTKSDAELMQEVSDQLERLNWYTDETSYDFTEMVASIGKFTSAGIGLEEAVTAMEGIANWAGISGATKQEANRAMYNISQALSGGFMRLQDWKSIENANMATKEFKEMVIQSAINRGTLEQAIDEAGNIIYGVSTSSGFNEVNYKTVASTLTEGKWLTNEVLTDTLALYGEFTDELSKVYDDINETADVTTSQIIKMTNQWKDGTLDMSEAMAITGKSAEELEAIFASLGRDEYDLGRRAFAAAQEAKTFREAIDATKDAVSTGWMNVFEKLFGNYEEAKVLWTDLANELWEIFAGPISDINDVLTAWRNNDDLGDGRDDLIDGLKNIYRAARSVVDPITEAWNAIFPSATYQDIWNFTHRFKEFTDGLILGEDTMKQISMVFEDFFRVFKTFSSAFKEGGGFGKFFEGVGGIIKNGTDRAYDFLLGVQKIRSVLEDYESGNLGEFSIVQQIKDAYPAAAKFIDVYDKVIETAEVLGKTFGTLLDYTTYLNDGVLTFDSVISGVQTRIAALLGSASELIHLWTGKDVSRTVDNIRNFLFDLTDGLRVLVNHSGWGRVKEGLVDIGAAITDTFGPAWKAAIDILNDWLEGLRMILGGASGDLNGFFDTIVAGLEGIAGFIRSGKGAVEFLSDFLVRFLSLKDAIETYRENGGGIVGFLAVVNEKLKIIFDTIADLIEKITGFDVHGIGDSILSVIQGIGYAFLQVADTISKAFGWKDNPFAKMLGAIDSTFGGGPEGKGFDLSGIFTRIGDAFLRLGELVNQAAPGISVLLRTVGDAFKNLWELIGQIRLDDLIKIFQGIASIMLMFQAKNTMAEIGETLEAYQKKLKADMLFAIAGSILMIAGAALMISKIDAQKIDLVLGTLGTSFAGIFAVMLGSRWADAKSLAALPGTVLAVAASMVILAKAAEMMTGPVKAFAEMEKFWDGMGKLGAIMGSFLVLLGILGALNKSGAVINASKALGKLAVVLAVMLPITLAYSKIDWDTFGDGLLKAALGIAGIGAALALVSEFEKWTTSISHKADFMSLAKGLLTLSAAVGVLTAVMFALTKLDTKSYFASLGKMLLILAVAAGGVWLFSKALTAFGETMFLLDRTGAMKALDRFSTVLVKLGTAMLLLTVGTLGLGLIAKILGDSAQEIAAAGVNLIVVVLDAIVSRTPEIAEDLVLFVLGVLDAVADHTPEIVDACVRIIGGIMQGIHNALNEGGVNLVDFLAGSAILAGLIGLMAVVKKVGIGIKDWAKTALVLAGAAVLLVEMGALFYGIGELSALVGGPEGLAKFGEFANALVHVFTDDYGVLVMFGALLAFELLLGKYQQKLGGEAGAGNGFRVAAVLLGGAGLLIAEMGALFGLVGALASLFDNEDGTNGVIEAIKRNGELFAAIAGVFSENGGVFLLFTSMIALEALLGKMKVKAGDTWSVFGSVISVLTEAVLLIDALGLLFAATGGLISLIEDETDWGFLGTTSGTGKGSVVETVNRAGDFLEAISIAVGKFFGGFVSGGIQGVSSGVTDAAIEAVKALADVALTIAESGLVANLALWTGGPIGLAVMTAELKDMAPHFVEFANGISGLSDNTANKAAVCAEALAAIIDAVPKTGGIPSLFLGQKDMEKFGKGLEAMGNGIAKYAGTLLEYTEEDLGNLDLKTDKIIAIIDDIKDVTPETNTGLKWFLNGANDIGTFGTNLEKFGSSLAEYAKSVTSDDVNVESLNSVTDVITDLGTWATTIKQIGSDGISNVTSFGDALKSFGGGFKKYYESIEKIDIDKVNQITTAIDDTIDVFMGHSDTSLSGKVATLTMEFLDKLVEIFSGDKTKKKSDAATDKFVDYFAERFKNVVSVAKVSVAITEMIKNAIGDEELKEGLKQAGMDLVTGIGTGITSAVDEEKTGLKAVMSDKIKAVARLITNQEITDLFTTKGGDLIKNLKRGMFPDTGIGATFRDAIVKFGTDVSAIFAEQVGAFQNAGKILAGGVIGGMTGTDMTSQINNYAKNVTDGFANSIRENTSSVQSAAQAVVDAVKKPFTNPIEKGGVAIASPSKLMILYGWYLDGGLADGLEDGIPMILDAVGTVVDETKEAFTMSAARGGFDIHSNSWLTTLYGRFLDGGLGDGLIDGIPGIKAAIEKVRKSIRDGMGINEFIDLMKQNGLDVDGMLEDKLNEFITKFGADFDLEGTMNDVKSQYEAAMSDISTTGMEEFMAPYMDNSYATDGVSVLTTNISDAFDEYDTTIYGKGSDSIYSYYDGIGENAVSAAELNAPKVRSASETIADAATSPIVDNITEVLSYVDWLKKEYPEGVTQAITAPVLDFSELYDNMQGGQLEAILNMFDAMNDNERSMMIRSYGLGENGGNEDLANYLKWYWNNEPIRMQNEENIQKAMLGYQTYLEEQKALQEAQAIQTQQNYEGVQQIATDMQAHTDEFNAKYMSMIEEIKMSVMSIQEELDGVHEDIVHLNEMDVYIDGDALVGATAEKMDNALGQRSRMNERKVTR